MPDNWISEMKNLWKMKVTVILIVISALGTTTKWLVKGLEEVKISGRVESIQTPALLRSANIPGKSPCNFRRLDLTQAPFVNTGEESSQRKKNNKKISGAILFIIMINIIILPTSFSCHRLLMDFFGLQVTPLRLIRTASSEQISSLVKLATESGDLGHSLLTAAFLILHVRSSISCYD